MLKKMMIIVLLSALHTVECQASQATRENPDLKKFYALKKSMPAGSDGYDLIQQKMTDYYLLTEDNNTLTLIQRLKRNSRLLENNDENFAIHMLAVFNTMIKRNERLTIVPLIHQLEHKVKALKDKELLSRSEAIIGLFYHFANKNKSARLHLFNAINISKKAKDTAHFQILYYNVGVSYYAEDNYKMAEKYLQKAMELERFGFKEHHFNLMITIVGIKDAIGKPKEALVICEKLVPYVPESHKAHFYLNLGQLYLTDSNYKKAEKMLLFAKKLCEKDKTIGLEAVYDDLAECYSKMELYEQSYHYLRLKDSALNAQKRTESLIELEQLKKQDLRKIRQLEKKHAKYKLQSEQTKIVRLILLLAVCALFLLLALFFVRQLRLKNKKLVRISLDEMREKTSLEIKTDSQPPINKVSYELVEKLEYLLNEKELFKDPDLTLQKLAKKLLTNVKDLSQTINGHYGVPFRALINGKRVDLAKRMLIEEKYRNYSMAGIAETVGYANKSSFYKHFKEITGVTPSNFQSYAKEMIK